MDKKSILIGALGASLLFVTLGAGVNQNESPEWQPVSRIGVISEMDSKSADTGELTSFFSFKMLYAKYSVEEVKWIYKKAYAAFTEPRD